jgi:putative membrane protein
MDERARDHLANERTYLAWLRTALAVLAAGALLARLTTSEGAVTAAAAGVTVAVGALALGYGTWRYYRVRTELERDSFTPAGRGPLYMTLIVVLAVAVVLPLLAAA